MILRPNCSLLITIIMLSACSNPNSPEALERQYAMLDSANPWSLAEERCTKGKEVADAWLRAENRQKYDEWSLTSGIQCNRAELNRLDER